jgi:CheY-like chemotaxis protein
MPKLLIADDSMFQRFMHCKVAKELGFDVVEAKDGADCLEKARTEKPDALLLDLNMPGMNGVEVVSILRDEGFTPRIMVVTADIQDTTRKRCLDLGVADFLNKPVDENVLRAKLGELVGPK